MNIDQENTMRALKDQELLARINGGADLVSILGKSSSLQ